MIENSSAGLVMLEAEVAVSVTREEHHQSVLARYPVAVGAQRRVAVELGWCAIGSGKYRGQPAIEVRLDGYRVGELTYLMSQRYGPIVAQVTPRGGRAGCQAVIERGPRGVEVTVRLPRQTDGTVPIPLPTPGSVPTAFPGRPPVPSVPRQRQGVFSSHRPLWIGAAVVTGLIVLGAVVGNDDGPSPSTTTASDNRTTTTTRPPTTTARPTTTTTTPPPTTTMTVAPEPVTVAPPVPKTTTKRATPAPPPAAPEPEPTCDPNYSGCVPVASDVDCAGGSGDGPAYVAGPIKVIGSDIYRLDHDKDGTACE